MNSIIVLADPGKARQRLREGLEGKGSMAGGEQARLNMPSETHSPDS